MTSNDYNKISHAIGFNQPPPTPSKALTGTYAGDPTSGPLAAPRKFLGYVLGDGHDHGTGAPLEVVLAYQYEGYNTDTTHPAKNWRCFQLDKFVGTPGDSLTEINFASLITPPPHLIQRQVARQNCVARGIGGGPRLVRTVDYHT